ncbi:hypothetical protein D3C80_1521220 [compost metagenome]
MLVAQRGGGDAHHHRVATGGNRVAETHQPYLQLLTAQRRPAAEAERMDHPRLADHPHRITEPRLFERRQMLAQGRFDIANDLSIKRRLLRRASRVEEAAADTAGLGQLQAQVPQVAAPDRASEPRQRSAADFRP